MSQSTMAGTSTSESAMKFRIVISETGKIGFFTESGTFEQGNKQVEKILAALGASGISFEEIGQPEQHRHDEEGEGVLSEAHAMSHAN